MKYIKLNASIVQNIKSSTYFKYLFYCIFPVSDLHLIMYFSHIARVGRFQKEDLLTCFHLISLPGSTQNYSSYPARIIASHKQTSLPASKQAWQNLPWDSNTGALL